MAVTQCQLSWALLATIGCSAVCYDDDDDDDAKDDDNDDDQAQILKLRHFTLRCPPLSIFWASQSSERKCSQDLLKSLCLVLNLNVFDMCINPDTKLCRSKCEHTNFSECHQTIFGVVWEVGWIREAFLTE